MPITALSGLAPEMYTPEQEGEESPTQFKLKPLNGIEYLELLTHTKGLGVNADGLKVALRYGLVGWVNFNDSEGVAVPFNRDNFSIIPPGVLSELSMEIISKSSVSGEVSKNS